MDVQNPIYEHTHTYDKHTRVQREREMYKEKKNPAANVESLYSKVRATSPQLVEKPKKFTGVSLHRLD